MRTILSLLASSCAAVIMTAGAGAAAAAPADLRDASTPARSGNTAAAPVAAAPGARHATGALFNPQSVSPVGAVARVGAAAQSLPDSVDLREYALPVGNQGSVGSCASWATGYAVGGWFANAQGHWGAPFAPMYLYSQVHVKSTGDGGGSYISSNFLVMQGQGIAERRVYTQGDYNWKTKPGTAQKANAANHKTDGFSVLFSYGAAGPTGIEAMKTALADGKPLVVAIPVYSPFFYLNAQDSVMTAAKATGGSAGGHAIAAMGYNSTGLIIQNSWGTGWGNAGYATLAWDFVSAYLREAYTFDTGFVGDVRGPVVTSTTARTVSTDGGATLTIKGTDFPWVDATSASAVQLVNVLDSAIRVNAPVTARSGNSLTVTVPQAPQVSGSPVPGEYRVVVTNDFGVSRDVVADDLTYVTPTGLNVVGGGFEPATGGSTLTITGTGFGKSKAAFTAKKITATVGGTAAALKWVKDSALTLTLPAGTAGTSPAIVLSVNGVAQPSLGAVRYASNISKIVTAVSPGDGSRTLTVTGSGLAGSTDWTLSGPVGSTLAIPTFASAGAVGSSRPAVVVTSNTSAQVWLPADPGGLEGTWALSLAPDTTAYPGATFLSTTAATMVYRKPAISSLSLRTVSTAGGATITATGTDLGSLDLDDVNAVMLVNSGGGVVLGTLTSRTATTAVFTTPALQARGYKVRVSSHLGTSKDTTKTTIIAVPS